jgi:hypothetical protein
VIDFNHVGEVLDAAETKIEELKVDARELESLRELLVEVGLEPGATHEQAIEWLRRKLSLEGPRSPACQHAQFHELRFHNVRPTDRRLNTRCGSVPRFGDGRRRTRIEDGACASARTTGTAERTASS